MVWKMGSSSGDIDDRPVGEDALHAFDEDFPFLRAVEVVAHEEAAAQKVFAEAADLRVGQLPVAHLDAVEPRPVVLVAFVEVDRLLDGARRGCASGGGWPATRWRSERG